MRVSHVALDDFRSWRHAVVEFPPGTTVLVGRNGQGKTNLVEAIAYLSAFSSHRVGAEGALVRVPARGSTEPVPGGAVIRVKLVSGEGRPTDEGGAPDAPVPPAGAATPGGDGPSREAAPGGGAAHRADREQVIELEIVRGRANRARLNRTQVRPRDIVGMVRTVVFAPEDLQLVRGDPSVRRAFLDDLAVQLHPTMQVVRSDFERVARQRAALMKQASARMRRGMTPDLSTLDVWDRQFAGLSARMTAARQEVVSALAGPAADAYRQVSDSPQDLEMDLDVSVDRELAREARDERVGAGARGADAADPVPAAGEDDLDEGARRVLGALRGARSREVERGVNLVGAQRDDLSLHLGGLPVRGYASHGESWSVALALRLGAFSVLERDGEEPILILDDVFAELDAGRREGLVRMVAGADQVLVTAAVPEDVPASLRGHWMGVRIGADQGSVLTRAPSGARGPILGPEVGDE